VKRDLILAERGNAAESRRLRRQAAAGKIEQVYPGIFVTPGEEPIEITVRRGWPMLVGYLFPQGVVTDRSGIESQPTKWEEDVSSHIFVSAPKSPQAITLPGLVLNQRKGPGPIEGEDVPFMGAWIAGPARRVLDNIALSRARKGPPRTLGPREMEIYLESYCSSKGERALNALRDDARSVADRLGEAKNFEALDTMIGGLLGSREHRLSTHAGKARAAGQPIDRDCLERVQALYAHLVKHPVKDIPDASLTWRARANSCFFESYFSNYIEGTRFLVEEAREIVFDGKIPEARPEDGHDIQKTYLKLMEPPRPRMDEISAEEFVLGLQLDHGEIMRQRPDISPGEFKTTPNAAGNTVFVSPEKVRGTLMEGLQIVQAASDPFSRALIAHFLISDVHPFNDGNGRLCRTVMSRELVSHGLSHAVVATAFRNDYLDAMRALTRRGNPDILVRSMMKCQEVSAACVSEDFEEALDLWAGAHAFLEDGRHVVFAVPEQPLDIEWRNGIPASASYWRALDHDEGGGSGAGIL
jgi:Fic/DOC family